MKHFQLTFLLVMLMSMVGTKAFSFYENGIYYKSNDDGTVSVTGSLLHEGEGTDYSGNITIPERVTYGGVSYDVTSISNKAFLFCNVTSISIPQSVTSIGSGAFEGTPWYNSQPAGMVYAGLVAYHYKGYMPIGTEIVLKNGTKGIADEAFVYTRYYQNNDGSYVVDKSGREGLVSIIIPNSVMTIGNNAFMGCWNLTSINIPQSVLRIGNAICDGEVGAISCLASISVDKDNPMYDSRNNCNAIIETATNKLIQGCQTTIIPYGIEEIDSAFEGQRGLTSITIPSSVTAIGKRAFNGCSGLTSVTIPNSVTSIGERTFSGCSGLNDVYCYAENVPATYTNAFYYSPIASATLHVPAGSLEQYKATEPWSGFGSIVPIEGYTTYNINDEMASLNIASEESGCIVNFTHDFNGEWEALCLPFAIDYDAIKADFDLAEIDGVVQNDDNNDGIIDFTVLSIRGFKEQTTEPNTPYLIRAKNAGEQTISFEDITVYPTAITSVDCSSTSTKYEFTGSYNALDASALTNRYVVQDGQLVKGASSLAPCRWYMTATSRTGAPLNLPSKIRIMPVEDVITGSPLLTSLKEGLIYNLAGQQMVNGKLPKGINIIRMSDGTTRKVIMR